jgi:hypothetical protein
MFGLPLLRASTRNTGGHARKGYVHDVLLCEHRRPEEYQQPVLPADRPGIHPHGYNSLGTKYIDYGLGANPNPAPDGTRFHKNVPGDIPEFRGLFKAPSVRGTDKRPSLNFVKAYMHNGIFKSLEDVVHFYNKRNIAVNATGAAWRAAMASTSIVAPSASLGCPFQSSNQETYR